MAGAGGAAAAGQVAVLVLGARQHGAAGAGAAEEAAAAAALPARVPGVWPGLAVPQRGAGQLALVAGADGAAVAGQQQGLGAGGGLAPGGGEGQHPVMAGGHLARAGRHQLPAHTYNF